MCLKQWSYEKDSYLMERGQLFIKNNFQFLDDIEGAKNFMTVGFEILLFPLLDEAMHKEIISMDQIDKYVEFYLEERKHKIEKIKYCEGLSSQKLTGKVWLFSLEGLGDLYSVRQIESMFSANGLIAGSYESTAFALIKGIDNSESYSHIAKNVTDNNGGVDSLFKVEIFDLSWSLAALHFAGYPIDAKILERHFDRLESIWSEHEGMIGGSVHALPPDADDISNTLMILTIAGRLKGREALQTLIKFFRDHYFVTYEAEQTPSLTTNAHCLLALSQYQQFEDISEMSNKCVHWFKNWIIANKYKFYDKWNLSRYYGMSMAILALVHFDIDFVSHIVAMIIDEQRSDGGWGIQS